MTPKKAIYTIPQLSHRQLRAATSLCAGIALALAAGGAFAVDHTISASNNFTMIDSTGVLSGGATDVSGTFDDTLICTDVSCTDISMTLGSQQPFFGQNWTAHDIRTFSEGSYTFDTNCTGADIAAGTTDCGGGAPLDLTVGPGQLGAHMLFDWGVNSDIDVAVVWNIDDSFGSPIYDAAGTADEDLTQTPTRIWNLASKDGNGDGIQGIPMVDGAFIGFNANFSLDMDPPFSFDIPTGPVDLTGTVEIADGTPLCSMVLASGQFMFTCNPIGPFSLTDLPRETDGTVKRQVYVDGFFPNIDVLPDSVDEIVVMTRSGTCPSYNTPYDPAVTPGSAGNRIDISGTVLVQDTSTPICAMVLANGQFMFSCDGSGSYALNIPLDTNGQFKLQVYADGFAPTIQFFDEFQPINDVGMARAAECL